MKKHSQKEEALEIRIDNLINNKNEINKKLESTNETIIELDKEIKDIIISNSGFAANNELMRDFIRSLNKLKNFNSKNINPQIRKIMSEDPKFEKMIYESRNKKEEGTGPAKGA